MHTGVVEAKPNAWSAGTWRPWTIWLPGTLALVWSGLLIIADGLAGAMGAWGTPDLPRVLRWERAGVLGHSLLVASGALVLAVGLRFPARRRAAAVAAWIIIPVAFGWFLLTGRLGSG